jgi:hypothetical protein
MRIKLIWTILILLSTLSKLHCQNRPWHFGLFAGPNITNIYDFSSGGGQYFFPFGGERPYHSINYAFGISAEKDFFRPEFLKNKFLIGFERFSSSVDGFNNMENEAGNFLNATILTLWKPDKNKNIYLFAGPSFYYLINSVFPFVGREWESSMFTIQSGINFQIINGLDFSVVWNEPLSKFKGNTTGSSIIAYTKVRSFQFLIGYKFSKK